jgi:hypothetical protein
MSMKFQSGRHIFVAFLITLCSSVFALGSAKDAPPFEANRWLDGPNQKNFPWEVLISPPYWSFQQRQMVQINVNINGDRLQDPKNRKDLHFVIKVTAADTRLVSDYSYESVPIKQELDGSRQIHYVNRISLRPGLYSIAILVYDALLHKGNVRQKRVRVNRPKGDPLPELDRDLPDIEFFPTKPQEDQASYGMDWPLSRGKEWLPVNNNRCLCIDIVANTSVDYDSNYQLGQFDAWNDLHRSDVKSSDVLQASSVLSHLTLRKGRIRVSILDTLRMKTFLDWEEASTIDWQRVIESLEKRDPFTINADVLGSQTQASAYLSDKLQKIMEDDACANEAEIPLKIVIVVSRDTLFAERIRLRPVLTRIPPQDPASVRFFYFCLTEPGKWDDDLFMMLKKTKPQRFNILDPYSFRTTLAALISSLEQMK